MGLQVFLAVLCLLLAFGEGKKDQGKIKKHNCTAESSLLDGVSAPYFSYIIVSKNTSCMHYAWSVEGNLTLFLAHTNGEETCNCSNVKFNHTSFPDDGSVKLPGLDSDFSLGVVFTKLVEFNATKHNRAAKGLYLPVACSEEKIEKNLSYSQFLFNETTTWTFVPETSTLVGTWGNVSDVKYKDMTRFSIKITIPHHAGSGRLKYFPKTLFTDTSSVFDIISENYPYANRNRNSRYALEMMVVHGHNVKSGSITMGKSPDDEYTPSVFTTFTYHTSGRNNASVGGFAQWKPISYQSSGRKSTESQQVTIVPAGNISECLVKEVPHGLASALFGSDVSSVGNVTRWFVVFGTPGDGNYINSTYNTWTVVAGYGDVPKDSVSVVIIITIVVGVGIPIVLVLLGGVYVFIKKRPWQNVHRIINSRRGRGYSRLS